MHTSKHTHTGLNRAMRGSDHSGTILHIMLGLRRPASLVWRGHYGVATWRRPDSRARNGRGGAAYGKKACLELLYSQDLRPANRGMSVVFHTRAACCSRCLAGARSVRVKTRVARFFTTRLNRLWHSPYHDQCHRILSTAFVEEGRTLSNLAKCTVPTIGRSLRNDGRLPMEWLGGRDHDVQ